jgi:hypothetical protein
MALTLGIKSPLDFRVYCATAAFSLAVMAADHKRRNTSERKPLPYRTRKTRLAFGGVR